MLKAIGIILAVSGLSVMAFAEDIPDAQSTSGPIPPAGVMSIQMAAEATGTEVVIDQVPGYAWRHGCGPTAVGMVVGYYDRMGFHKLIDGDSATQTNAVNQAIASQRGAGDPGHYEDYSLPIDNTGTGLLADKSESTAGDAHSSDCIADYMQASWSSEGNYYGWSWNTDIDDAFIGFVNQQAPAYQPAVNFYYRTLMTWALLQNEIDAGRPMVFLVDTDGDNRTDHFVTVVGYRTSPSNQYGCLDTWSPYDEIRWYNFEYKASGVLWGIYEGWAFELDETAITDGDINDDGVTNLLDFQILAAQWNGVPGSPSADILAPKDGAVDVFDLLVLANHWLQ